MTALAYRNWVPSHSEQYVQGIARETSGQPSGAIAAAIDRGIALNRTIHEADCINLNPATNVMNPKAEAALASGLGSRPSLGYPGDKYEMGLEGIERIEVIAAELAAEIFAARYAEIRVASGAIANLYGFMLAAKPGERIIVPPPAIGGHAAGAQARQQASHRSQSFTEYATEFHRVGFLAFRAEDGRRYQINSRAGGL